MGPAQLFPGHRHMILPLDAVIVCCTFCILMVLIVVWSQGLQICKLRSYRLCIYSFGPLEASKSINPRRKCACIARVTVLGLCVCHSVCVSMLISMLLATKWMVSNTNGFSVINAQKMK